MHRTRSFDVRLSHPPSAHNTHLMDEQIGRSSDSWTRTNRPSYLPRFLTPGASAWLGVRFHLPLRGSPGFAPDSLLSQPDPKVCYWHRWAQHIGRSLSGQPNNLWTTGGSFTCCDPSA
jgi:hypothetical protein